MASLRRSPFTGRGLFGGYRTGGHRDGILALQSMTIAVNESVFIGVNPAARYIGVPPVTNRYLGRKTLY